jgi:hypothetical protein
MFRHGLLRLFLALLVIGGLAAGGSALYRTGWEQGYQTAVLTLPAAGGDGAQLAPRAPMPAYGYGPMGGYGFGRMGFFNPFGFLFGIGGFLVFLLVTGGLLRMLFWRGRRGWGGPNGPNGWRHGPPWAQPSQPETQPEKKDQ